MTHIIQCRPDYSRNIFLPENGAAGAASVEVSVTQNIIAHKVQGTLRVMPGSEIASIKLRTTLLSGEVGGGATTRVRYSTFMLIPGYFASYCFISPWINSITSSTE